MSAVIMLIVGGALVSASPAVTVTPDTQSSPKLSTGAVAACPSHDSRNIVVCGQRGQSYRLDPSVMDAGQEAESNSRSAASATPSAEAACSASPTGCTKDLSNLDLANVAIVAATTVIRAARGDDWAKVFRPGGPNEYKLYQQAKRQRDAEADERAGAEAKRKAEAQEREAHAGKPDTD